MFAEFRAQYPRGSIQTEMLAKIDGLHAFRAVVSHEGIILATAIGVDSDLETAEDRAVKRALTIAGISDSYRLSASLESDYEHLPILSPAPPKETAPAPKPEVKLEPAPAPMDLSDYIAQIGVEMERVGWDTEKGRQYIKTHFKKRTRQELTHQELQQFLQHLRSLPAYIPPDSEF